MTTARDPRILTPCVECGRPNDPILWGEKCHRHPSEVKLTGLQGIIESGALETSYQGLRRQTHIDPTRN